VCGARDEEVRAGEVRVEAEVGGEGLQRGKVKKKVIFFEILRKATIKLERASMTYLILPQAMRRPRRGYRRTHVETEPLPGLLAAQHLHGVAEARGVQGHQRGVCRGGGEEELGLGDEQAAGDGLLQGGKGKTKKKVIFLE
jgi:hypothetical protein